MNTIRTLIALGTGMILSMEAHAETNQVNVKKVEQDLYQTSDGLYIETRFCAVDTNGDKAVLNYEKYACKNNLRFSSNKTCEVQFVYR
jgi:hypothetical protein